MSLHQAVALCMDHCDAAGLAGDDSWFKTVVLTGGSACLPGLAGSINISLSFVSFLFCNAISLRVNQITGTSCIRIERTLKLNLKDTCLTCLCGFCFVSCIQKG